MKALIIKSSQTDEIMAEIRTDGHAYQFVMDKTNGKIQSLFAKGLIDGINKIDESDNLEIVSNPNVKSYTYVLTNGDTIVITTDGKSACLNGRLLSNEEFAKVHELLAQGKLKVSKKANMDYPDELQGISRPVQSPIENTRQAKFEKSLSYFMKQSEKDIGSFSRNYDPNIENMEFPELDQNMHDMMKKIVYDAVYGTKK